MVVTNARIGGVVEVNNESGVIKNCAINSNLILSNSTYGKGAAFIHTNKGTVMNCYVRTSIIAPISQTADLEQQVSGFVLINSGTINDSYAVCSVEGKYAKKYGFCKDNTGKIKNCFYNLSANSGYDLYAQVKSLSELKKITSFNDWDFDNVWGISSEVNDGYPYLLWEYANNSSVNIEVIGVISEDDSLKFISEVKIIGKPDIINFGTMFIPLWLFEVESMDVAMVEYENSEYRIKNGQTFGATLSNIPEDAKNMLIVGKSFIKDIDGNYIWSKAKATSILDTTLLELE